MEPNENWLALDGRNDCSKIRYSAMVQKMTFFSIVQSGVGLMQSLHHYAIGSIANKIIPLSVASIVCPFEFA